MNTYDLREQKLKLRKTIKLQREEMPAYLKENYDEIITGKFLNSIAYRNCTGIIAYSSLAGEINTEGIILHALQSGRRVALPRCEGESSMSFYEVKGPGDLSRGSFGIMEPDPQKCRPADIDSYEICLVPGLSFDKMGYRLGYGRGYYDRALKNYSGTKIGLIYSRFVADGLPHGRYDIKADVLFSEKGVTPALK